MDKNKVIDKIVSLRFDIDNYMEDRDYRKVAEIRKMISNLESSLRDCK
jgi:protein-arginine kinase activator protein McsA